MKRLLPLIFVVISSVAYCQNYNVTFRVDMSEVGTISDTISVAGDFQAEAGYPSDWTPGKTLMTDPNMDHVYEKTVSIPAGTYLFKYINGTMWGQDEGVPAACAVGSGLRQVVVSADTTLMAVCFSSCSSCAPTSNLHLTFRVDMSEVATISDTVSVAGDFQMAAGFPADWDPGATVMTDADMDSIYEITVLLPAGTYQFKYLNGAFWGYDEGVPAACAVSGVRQVVLSTDSTLTAVCFASCSPCSTVGIEDKTNPFVAYIANGSDYLHIEFGNNYTGSKEVELLDCMGRVIFQQQIDGNEGLLNIASLSNGLYFVRLQNDHSAYSRKILKF